MAWRRLGQISALVALAWCQAIKTGTLGGGLAGEPATQPSLSGLRPWRRSSNLCYQGNQDSSAGPRLHLGSESSARRESCEEISWQSCQTAERTRPEGSTVDAVREGPEGVVSTRTQATPTCSPDLGTRHCRGSGSFRDGSAYHADSGGCLLFAPAGRAGWVMGGSHGRARRSHSTAFHQGHVGVHANCHETKDWRWPFYQTTASDTQRARCGDASRTSTSAYGGFTKPSYNATTADADRYYAQGIRCRFTRSSVSGGTLPHRFPSAYTHDGGTQGDWRQLWCCDIGPQAGATSLTHAGLAYKRQYQGHDEGPSGEGPRQWPDLPGEARCAACQCYRGGQALRYAAFSSACTASSADSSRAGTTSGTRTAYFYSGRRWPAGTRPLFTGADQVGVVTEQRRHGSIPQTPRRSGQDRLAGSSMTWTCYCKSWSPYPVGQCLPLRVSVCAGPGAMRFHIETSLFHLSEADLLVCYFTVQLECPSQAFPILCPFSATPSVGESPLLRVLLLQGGSSSSRRQWNHWVLVSSCCLPSRQQRSTLAATGLSVLYNGPLQRVHKRRIGCSGSPTTAWTFAHIRFPEEGITLSFVDFMSFFCASFREPVLLHYLAPTCPAPEMPLWGLTDTSVALGCRPSQVSQVSFFAPASTRSPWLLYALFSACYAFFKSLLLVLFAALAKVLLFRAPGHRTPMGRALTVPIAFAPTCCVKALAVASPSEPVLGWQQPLSKIRTRQVRVARGLRPFQALWLMVFGFAHMPFCVWSAPSQAATCQQVLHALSEAAAGAAHHASLQPENLTRRFSSSDTTVDLPGIAGPISNTRMARSYCVCPPFSDHCIWDPFATLS